MKSSGERDLNFDFTSFAGVPGISPSDLSLEVAADVGLGTPTCVESSVPDLEFLQDVSVGSLAVPERAPLVVSYSSSIESGRSSIDIELQEFSLPRPLVSRPSSSSSDFSAESV